jgi:hypothetical protein
MKIGRNDPCPCGSGKKYKKCCLETDEAAAREQRAAAQAPPAEAEPPGEAPATAAPRPDRLSIATAANAKLSPPYRAPMERLVGWVAAKENRAHVQRALDCFRRRWLIDQWDDMTLQIARDWMLIGYQTSRGRTLAQTFLSREGHRLPTAERESLARLIAEPYRLLEVIDLQTDGGCTARDVYSGKEFRLRDWSAIGELRRWDFFLARLQSVGDDWEVGAAIAGDRRIRQAVLNTVNHLLAELQPKNPRVGHAEVLRVRLPDVIEAFLECRNQQSLPDIGENIDDAIPRPYVATYRVLNAAGLREALSLNGPFLGDGLDRYIWAGRRGRQPKHRRRLRGRPRIVLAGLSIDRGFFFLDAISRAFRRKGKARIEKLAAAHLQHIVDCREVSVKNVAIANRPRDLPEAPPLTDAEKRRIADSLDNYFREWPDRIVTALAGLTPRQAAAEPENRPYLVELVQNMENERPAPGVPEYDFTEIKRELQLTEIL